MSSDDESSGSYESDVAEEQADESSEEEEEVVPVKRKAPAKPKKDPNKPKRNMSAFFLYSNAHRARIRQENPDIAFGQVAKTLSIEFKAITPKERTKWDKKAAKDKERYLEEMTHYVPPDEDSDSDDGGVRKPKKKAKAKKDPNAPKRNQSAFFLYSNKARPQVKVDYPEATFGGIAKIISQQFKALNQKERAKFDKLAAEDKIRYQAAIKEYNQ